MKGEPKVLQNLQRALTMELTAIHQYLLHSHVVADWGLDKLAASGSSSHKSSTVGAIETIDTLASIFLPDCSCSGSLTMNGTCRSS